MRNIDWLYQTNSMFRETVNQGAAQWMGSDSPVFAGEWLLREHEYEHHDSDYEDLTGQRLDGPCVVPDGFCSDAAKPQISQFVAQETWETAESNAAKSEIRDFTDNRDEQVDRITDVVNAKWDELHGDSREKLEADVREYANPTGAKGTLGASWERKMLGFLDRQAAVTERECREYEDALREQHHKRIAELRAKLDAEAQHAREAWQLWGEADSKAEQVRTERDELEAFAKRLEEAAKHGDDVTLFGVGYVSASDAEYLDGWDSSSVVDLLHQYEDGKLMRDCDMETHVLIETEALGKLAEKYRAGSVAAQEEAEAWRAKCGALLDAAHEMIRIGGDA